MVNMKLNILAISDIHLGHKKTKAEFIINNLYQFFITYDKVLTNLDMLIVAGDIFDRLLFNNSIEYNLAIEWLSNLSRYCKVHNIKLRILEGTPSHDFKQVSSFNTILTKLNIEVDFKYFDKIAIEHIKEYDMYILYVPDEMNEDAEETFLEVESLMKEHKINKVDLTVIHGQFHYHLPMFHSKISHTEENYLRITSGYVLCGHIHKHSNYDRIITISSFDRLAHGKADENKKGGVLLSLNGGINEYLFLENKNAKTYKTLMYHNESIDIIINDIRKSKFKEDSEIRIRINKESGLKEHKDILQNRFKWLNFKIEYHEEKEINAIENVLYETEEISITKENVISLMMEEIGLKLINNEKNILIKELEDIV